MMQRVPKGQGGGGAVVVLLCVVCILFLRFGCTIRTLQ